MNGNKQAGLSGDWLLNGLKSNPEGFLLLAAGAVLMMRKGSSLAAKSSQYVPDTVRETASRFADQTKETASSLASSASEYAGQARQAINAQSGRIVEQSGRIAEQTQSTIKSTVSRVISEQPLAIAVAGLAAGAAVASLLPATDFEREALGPIGERVSESAQQFSGQLKEATVKAGEKLRDVADERGLNVDGLKDAASEVVSAFGGTMSGASERGKRTGAEAQGSSTNKAQGMSANNKPAV